MDRIVTNDPDYGNEIAKASRVFYDPKCHANIARVKDGEVLAGVVYTNFNHESIQCHTAVFADHGMNRDLLFCGFDYPFHQLNVKRMFGFVNETNEDALHFNMNLGFREVARIEGFFPHGATCIVMRLDREDCRFLKIKPRGIALPQQH